MILLLFSKFSHSKGVRTLGLKNDDVIKAFSITCCHTPAPPPAPPPISAARTKWKNMCVKENE